MLTLALVPMLALPISVSPQNAARSPSVQPYHVEVETDDVRVGRVVLAPGDRVTVESPGGSVIVYMTANLDGRMPPAEAAWQPAGSIDMENRGRARFEALVIQFKRTVPASTPSAAPPPARTMSPFALASRDYGYGPWMDYAYERPKSETLVDTAGITVTKVRQPPPTYVEPASIDANDRVVVFLRQGYVWPSLTSYSYDALAVHRGEVRVLAGNEPYTFSNAGFDPNEFLVVARR
jgi:hypothetical protein